VKLKKKGKKKKKKGFHFEKGFVFLEVPRGKRGGFCGPKKPLFWLGGGGGGGKKYPPPLYPKRVPDQKKGLRHQGVGFGGGPKKATKGVPNQTKKKKPTPKRT